MYGSYAIHPNSSSYNAVAVAPKHESGLEAAVASAVTQANYGDLQSKYPSCSYAVMRPNPYVAVQMQTSQPIHVYSTTTSLPNAASSPFISGSAESPQSAAIYHSQPVVFLNPARPKTPFIAAAAEIADFIKSAFSTTTGNELPADITVTVAQRQLLQQIHPQFSDSGVAGLSLNSIHRREIFAVAGSLDEVMLVIGHELGHVLTPTLGNEKAEEAKAFAFEMAWANTIFLHDIAGLRNSINQAALNMRPAQNGLHNLAFAFVKAAALAGKEPLALHSELSLQQEFFNFESDFTSTAAANTAAIPAAYVPLISSTSASRRHGIVYSGYRNKSNVQNVPWLQNFTWADLGKGIYGMYIPLTATIFMNDRLLRTDLEQFHKTLGHEYILHHVMQLPDGYVAKILEDTIFWTKDENDKYKP